MSAADQTDLEHWPDNATLLSSTAPSLASGYDRFNGLRAYEYEPANEEKKDDKPEPESKSNEVEELALASTPAANLNPWQYMTCYPGIQPQMQYPMCVPAPVYYGLPPTIPYYHPFPAPAEEKPKPKKKASEPMKWQGRTRTEVQEDNMKIAAKEGAYASRKIEPVGLAEDQPVWVVLGDGTCSLRVFAEVKGMQGDWHEDPRFKGSLYFVCVQDKPEQNAVPKNREKSEKGVQKDVGKKEKEGEVKKNGKCDARKDGGKDGENGGAGSGKKKGDGKGGKRGKSNGGSKKVEKASVAVMLDGKGESKS